MSADDLRRELDLIADRAPVVDVPADAWHRARGMNGRQRVVVLGATAAVVAAIAAGIVWLPERTPEPVADGSAAVPTRLYSVPDGVDERETDLSIGGAAAAWLQIDESQLELRSVPVVVGAADGAYHQLDLPGFTGGELDGLAAATVSLSSDGRSLAYPYEEADEGGIRVVDLESGEYVTHQLPDGGATSVEVITWSPAGGWLAWGGEREARGYVAVVGRIDLDSGAVDDLSGNRYQGAGVGVRDDGVVAIGLGRRMELWYAAADVSQVAVETYGRRIVADSAGRFATQGPGQVVVVDGTQVDILNNRPGGSSEIVPMGWVGDELVVVTSNLDGDGDLRVVAPSGQVTRSLTRVDAELVESLSVAVDLMGDEPRTVYRAKPDWGFDWGTWWTFAGIGVSISVLLVLVGILVALLRRYLPAR
ncbi:hypothetical protein [Nocardioides sp.]|uniref:hypothetical protein n=1 Tax=Nocardioides sp. TaxID=35761 RepID=UPI001A23DBEA|nr:hypothetical protein [Nocardioides sp.]MBJ7356517.1 hypothetical protein [Nocardioides sp.]